MKNLFLLALSLLMWEGIAIAQTEVDAQVDQLIIKGRMLNMSTKYTKVLIIKGYDEVDTIHTIHLTTKNGKFELPPLDVHTNYTIVFSHDGIIKTLYLVGAGPDAIATYYMKITLDMFSNRDATSSVEYHEGRDVFRRYDSQALKSR